MRFSPKLLGYLCLLLTSLVWGTTWVVSKDVVSKIPPLQMTSMRQLLAGIVFVTFFALKNKEKLPTRIQFLWLLMMSLLCFVFANGISTVGVKYIPSGLASLIGALYPLCVYLLQSLFFRQRKFNLLTVLGFIVGVGGMLLVFRESAFHNMGENYIIGVLLSLFAMLSWSLGTIFIARNKFKMNSYYATGWQMMLSSVTLFFMSLSMEDQVSLSSIPIKVYLEILYLVIFGSIVAFAAFIYSNKTLTPSVASLYAYVNPFVAMVFAYFVIDEPLSLQLLYGAAITLIGVFMVNRGLKR